MVLPERFEANRTVFGTRRADGPGEHRPQGTGNRVVDIRHPQSAAFDRPDVQPECRLCGDPLVVDKELAMESLPASWQENGGGGMVASGPP